MKRILLIISILTISITCYGFTFKKVEYRRDMYSFNNRVFYLPPYQFLEISSAGFKEIISEFLLFKTIVYYGEMLMNESLDVNWDWIYKSFDASTRLDPYNIDAYYLAQPLLTWEAKMYKESTELLERGVKHRDWDWYLSFFVGFNYFYFFKDYDKAAEFYRKGGEINPELIQLAGRMYNMADRSRVAIAYLKGMLEEAENPIIRKSIKNRLVSVENSLLIKNAYNLFLKKFKRPPVSMEEFIQEGLLDKIPVDPYGKVYRVNGKGEVTLTKP